MIITIPKVRFIIGIPYLIFVGFAGGNILYEAIVLGLVCAIVDFIIESG